MRRALLAAACLLLTAVAVAPSASAGHDTHPCQHIHWHPAPPPGWNEFCSPDGAYHDVVDALACLAQADPWTVNLAYVARCLP